MPLRISLPMPPTDNNLYVPVRKKGKSAGLRLSDTARVYKVKVAEVMADAALLNPDFGIEENVEYAISLVVYFKSAYSKSWPKKAKSKFRKIDTHNRLKLVIDSVMGSMGLDDNCLFEQSVIKMEDPEDPRVEVEIRRWEWA